VTIAALTRLADQNQFDRAKIAAAVRDLGIDPEENRIPLRRSCSRHASACREPFNRPTQIPPADGTRNVPCYSMTDFKLPDLG